ncbi:hypothetical protein AVEN_58589-1 [Araneus ventricosus]|uniref:THAP-type domain-containing protein n=2 Tax=Araneus ventricosus TaxID=182803 RepID=A0A4Y2GWN7_ARAVE|nr:hypothetical protein AVEN_58589-1 [Araneus ventricosus]
MGEGLGTVATPPISRKPFIQFRRSGHVTPKKAKQYSILYLYSAIAAFFVRCAWIHFIYLKIRYSMVYKCSVFGCKGNYASGQKVSIFKFPKDPKLSKIWETRVMRENFKPTTSSRVCEMHFRKEDVLRETEYFDEKSGTLLRSPLQYPKLKEGAIPMLVSDKCPPSLQPTMMASRESPSKKRRRLEDKLVRKAQVASIETANYYLKRVTFTNLAELKQCVISQGTDVYWTTIFKGDKDKTISLMIDEIHLRPTYDYVGGKLYGMSYNSSNAATSAFVFMVQSLLSSYKDVAHILPVSTLTAEMFHSFLNKVIVGLETIGFKVIVVVTDNNAINKKAVSLFANPPKLKIRYTNPVYSERDFFFIFDTVHILKCVRNNWLCQKNYGTCMFYPSFDNFSLFKTASFQVLKKLHEIESEKLLKYGYGLTQKALAPTSFEKTVKHQQLGYKYIIAEGLDLLGAENNISSS